MARFWHRRSPLDKADAYAAFPNEQAAPWDVTGSSEN